MRRRRQEQQLDDELRFHLEMEAEKLRLQGLDEKESRRQARLRLGGLEPTKEAVRDEWRWHLVESVLEDVRFGIRTLAKSPAYTTAVVLTLALGIGANTAIFSLINGVLLQPLPYEEGGRLVLLRQSAPKAGLGSIPFSIPEVFDYRQSNRSLSGLVEHHSMTFTLLGRSEPERVSTGVVSAEFFDTLGVEPLLGRTFLPEDDDLGAEAVLVLSHGYWLRSFGGDREIVGRVFEMNNRPHTVVGVLPPIPQYPVAHDVYMPTSACPFRASAERARGDNRSAFRALTVFGRLADDSSLETTRTDFALLAQRASQEHPDTYPEERGYAITAEPLQEELTRRARPTLLVLLGTAALVLVIACANVANLSLARTLRRERETAIRASLGAGRLRLARQSLVESTLLALVGGLAGLLLAYGGLDLLTSFVARFTPRAVGIRIDGWVLLFTLGVSLLTGLLFGAFPALGRSRNLVGALREGGAATESGGHHRFRALLIAAQVAVAVVLLVAAGLMLRSLYHLTQVDPGFSTDNVLTARLSRNWSKYSTPADATRFFTDLLQRVRALPGVEAAGVGSIRPLDGAPPFSTAFTIENRPREEGELDPQTAIRVASTDYFRAMGIPLLRGRTFQITDDADAAPVTVVNEALAEAFWGDEDPIDERISLDQGNTWIRIVGLAANIREVGLDSEPTPAVYLPLPQSFWAQSLVVKTHGEPLRLIRQIKETVYAIDPEQSIDDFETLEETRRASMASPRLTALLLGLFAGLALVITSTGLAGVIAFAVSQRTHEIGIRMALGAPRGQVLMMMLRQGMVIVGLGLLVGLVAAVALSRTLSGLLFETAPSDPLTLAGVVLVLLAAAALACLLPARRATAVDPTVALRTE